MAKELWLRPKSSRMYLHPPLAERIVVLSPDMKITDSSLLDNGTHLNQPGIGMILLQGKDMDAFPYTETQFSTPHDGLPIYTANATDESGASVAMECFCGFTRIPTDYFRVTLRNDTNAPIRGCIGVLCRSGNDTYMTQEHQEGYAPYEPNVKNWYMLKRTWQDCGNNTAACPDGTLCLEVPPSLACRWVADAPNGHLFAASDYFRLDYSLEPGETFSFSGRMRAADTVDTPSYGEAREDCVRQWQEIHRGIRVMPDTDNAVYRDMYLSLVTQCYQMLAYYKDSDLLAVRQGDLGRFVWPYEATVLLRFLDRIGLREHTGDGYRYFCERWLVKEGEDAGRIASNCAAWENFTGSILWGLSEHLTDETDAGEIAYFLPKMFQMLEWIERRRHKESKGYAGIFPPGQGSDWPDVAQFWTFTDSLNVVAIERMAEMLKKHGHVRAEEVGEIGADYRRRIFEIRDEIYTGHETDEMYIFPHELGVPFEDSQTYSYYTDGAPMLLMTGFIEPGSRMMEQMENFFRRRGQFERGLTGRMTWCEGAWDGAYHGGYGDVWYTMQSEWFWLNAWLASGEREKVEETVQGLLLYGITPEYIVSERYCSVNPWYSPWQPNGSGSARMAQILLSYFGEKRL